MYEFMCTCVSTYFQIFIHIEIISSQTHISKNKMMYMKSCIYTYIYIYICMHTHTYTLYASKHVRV